jgi:F-type H+-transporting ATPase subunit b
MPLDAEFWVAVAFVLFISVLGYLGVHRKLFDELDNRSARIKVELDEARRLKADAENLLEAAQVKLQQTSSEARSILEDARAEARRLIEEARRKNDDLVARRSKQAETKIAEAELQAVAEIRAIVADVAISAAEEVLTKSLTVGVRDVLLVRDIAELHTQFNGSGAAR